MERNCKNCGKFEVKARGLCNACYLRWQRYGDCEYRRKRKTNADQIRSMTDEELAKFISGKARGFGEEYEGYASALDWLKEESSE